MAATEKERETGCHVPLVRHHRRSIGWSGLLRPLAPLLFAAILSSSSRAAETPPKVPRFSVELMDGSVDPSADIYKFAGGA